MRTVREDYLHPVGRGALYVTHRHGQPKVDDSAYVAPTAVLCGDVTIGPHCRVLFGAVITAEGGPVTVGANTIVMENVVVRGVTQNPVTVGENVIIGPNAHVVGCQIDGNARIATGAMIFNGAHLGFNVDIDFRALVHVDTVVPDGTRVPMGWFASGNPAELVPPGDGERVHELTADYTSTVFFGAPGASAVTESGMPDIARSYSRALALHRYDVAAAGGSA